MASTTRETGTTEGPEGPSGPSIEAAETDASEDASGSWRASLSRTVRAQGSNLVSLFMGILVAAIIGIAVVIPVVNDVIASSNISGTTATIVGLIPTFVGLMLLMGLSSPLMGRVQ
jgi:hypothetical protein